MMYTLLLNYYISFQLKLYPLLLIALIIGALDDEEELPNIQYSQDIEIVQQVGLVGHIGMKIVIKHYE